MSPRRLLSLLAALALLSPLTAVAVPACAPGPHCPMAGMAGEPPPCHGAAMQEDDCCVSAPSDEPAQILPVVPATSGGTDEGEPAPLQGPATPGAASCEPVSSPPLYRLFRTLLI